MGGDCDDFNARIRPGASETCNGLDDDCDGIVDEACDPDEDADRFPASEDCDDADPEVHVGVLELCNGVDDDCDGDVDEGACPPERSCGCAPHSRGVGLLAPGIVAFLLLSPSGRRSATTVRRTRR